MTDPIKPGVLAALFMPLAGCPWVGPSACPASLCAEGTDTAVAPDTGGHDSANETGGDSTTETDTDETGRETGTTPPELDLVAMPPGAFTMGSPGMEIGRDNDEVQHPVELTRGFEIGRTEVTQAQFDYFAGYDPSAVQPCPTCPVETVSWHEAAAFADAVSQARGLKGCYGCDGPPSTAVRCQAPSDPYACGGYRLPTEAEWEYAARAGAVGAFANDQSLAALLDADDCEGPVLLDGGAALGDLAWYCFNADEAQPVGLLAPNAAGLVDVSGNVREWCHDLYDEGYYTSSPPQDPAGPENTVDDLRVFRGGSHVDSDTPARQRLAFRNAAGDDHRDPSIGFRLARTLP